MDAALTVIHVSMSDQPDMGHTPEACSTCCTGVGPGLHRLARVARAMHEGLHIAVEERLMGLQVWRQELVLPAGVGQALQVACIYISALVAPCALAASLSTAATSTADNSAYHRPSKKRDLQRSRKLAASYTGHIQYSWLGHLSTSCRARPHSCGCSACSAQNANSQRPDHTQAYAVRGGRRKHTLTEPQLTETACTRPCA